MAEPPTTKVGRLLALVSPDNEALVSRWAEVLRTAGGFYQSLDEDGIRALAAGTIAILQNALNIGAVPLNSARRFVDPPPYRHQPLDQFVLAGMLVDRVLRDYLHEQAPDAETAIEAMRIIDPILAGAILQVVRLRQQRMGAGQLVADIGKLLSRARNPRRAFDAVADRLGKAVEADLCAIFALELGSLVLFGGSSAIAETGLATDFTQELEESDWLNQADDDRVLHRSIASESTGFEGALTAAGFTHLTYRALVSQGRRVGLLVFADVAGEGVGPQFAEHLDSLAPLIAAHLGYARQTGALERADAAIDDLFDASPNMMVELDRLGRIVRTNDRFRREIGMPGDVIGMPLLWLVHPAWSARFAGLWERIVATD
ncbi:MAG: PAS domain-containing protein, partial [Myxococcales bacterium]|nr:PAS domain-containing protein [Myxococcales bacterium]